MSNLLMVSFLENYFFCFLELLSVKFLQKKSSGMENIFVASKPFIRILNLFGLFPMSYDGPSFKGIFKTKWLDVVLSCFSFGLLISFTMSSLVIDYSFGEESLLLEHAWKASMKFDFFSHICLFIFQVKKRHDVIKFFEQVQDADEKVIKA